MQLNNAKNSKFDPFSDRLARDIRNSLSSALVSDLSAGKADSVDEVADSWRRQALEPLYQNYIHQTRERYRQVKQRIRSAHIQDPRLQAVVLWNAGLFFELHELLETIWHDTQGAARVGIKGLIQAAGVYVHQLRGNLDAARGLAERARRNLSIGQDCLSFIANLAQLIHSLEYPSRPAPRLDSSIRRMDDLTNP